MANQTQLMMVKTVMFDGDTNEEITIETPTRPRTRSPHNKQGHRHNGNQAARRPHMLCLIYVHLFGAFAKAVRLFKA